ncbi:extracellular lipase [Teratosphaeria destructans]|uniref:Extracellular lipase n=1 Tax=Teratosphaeria destructans TaxID=418781 RepID=A0A9W7SMP3_9PEZI|nr:extracellular lipase [Teratosphaeria destructans]
MPLTTKDIITLGLCALGALAQPTTSEYLVAKRADGRPVSHELFLQLEEGARLVDIAYCVGTGAYMGISAPFKCLSRCSDFPDFELVTTWNTGVMLSDSCGYLTLDHAKKRLLLVFRGTHSITNAIADLSTIPQTYVPYPDSDNSDEPQCHDCQVHSGFSESWIVTREQVMPQLEQAKKDHPDYQLHVMGHSLGGAVAALAGLDLIAKGWDPIVTTYGEPRTGNKGLIKYIDARFNLTANKGDENKLKFRRVTHIDDPVPQLPLSEWGFGMHAGEIHITKASLQPDVNDVIHCDGDMDQKCIAGQDPSTKDLDLSKRELEERGFFDFSGVPSRFKLWNMLSAHRDYFWRVGLCVPAGDLFHPGGGAGYNYVREQE